MVGGGRGAFIGGVHRRAANLDGQIELVAGPFSLIRKNQSFQERISFFLLPEFMAHIKKWRKKRLYYLPEKGLIL